MANELLSKLSYHLGGVCTYFRRQDTTQSNTLESSYTMLAHKIVKEIHITDATRRLAYLREQILANAKVHYQTKHVDLVTTIEYYREDLTPARRIMRHVASIIDGRDGRQIALLQDASQWKKLESGTKASFEELEIAMRGLLWRIAEDMGGMVETPLGVEGP